MGAEGYWAAMTATPAQQAVDRIAALEPLDQAAAPLAKAVRDAVPRGPVKDALSGAWLGMRCTRC